MSMFLVLLAAGAAAAPASAQTRSPDLDTAADAPEVVVTASRSARPLAQVGEAVSVLATPEIERLQSNNVLDLLRTLPGVAITRTGGIGTASSVFIRGAESDQTVALIDGVKLNDPSTPGGGFNFGNLLTGNIARIELVRGSQSVIWGSQAIGGVVNLITRAPTEELAVNARAEGGWRDTYQAVANVSGRVGPVAASLGGGWFKSDGLSAFVAGRERDGYENVGLNGKLLVDLTDTVAIDLRGYFSDGEAEVDGFPAPLFAFADTPERSRTRELVGYAGVNAAFLDGRFRNRAAITYTDTDRRSVNPSSTPNVTFDGAGRNERLEYQGIFTASPAFEAVFGAERETSRFRTSSFGGPVQRARVRLDSFYLQLSGAPVEGLRLTGGIRHDDHQSFGGTTSLAANAAWSLNGGSTVFRASYGEGFKAPSLFQLFSDFGNQALQPERARSYDLGATQRLLGGAIELAATWFRRDVRNQIDFVSCFQNPSPICTGRPSGTYDNIRRARASGIEATLGLNPTEALGLRVSYSYVDAENRDTGLALARRPKSSLSALADYRWPVGLATGATLTMIGDSFDNAANTRRLDGYALVDLRASYPLGRGLELYGRVENLFDARYETVFRYGTPGRAAYAGVRLAL
jgi:vitamin B12 transporter